MLKEREYVERMDDYFRENDHLGSIREWIQIGIWSIELEPGCAPRMYADRTMRKILGVQDNITPEMCFRLWHDNVFPPYVGLVRRGLEQATYIGHAEFTYLWQDDRTANISYLRCGAKRGVDRDKIVFLHGYHQDVTMFAHLEKETKRVAKFSNDIMHMMGNLYEAIHVIYLQRHEVLVAKTTLDTVCENTTLHISEYWTLLHSCLPDSIVNQIERYCKESEHNQKVAAVTEDVCRVRNEQEFWLNMTLCVTEFEQERTVVVLFSDISERKQQEQIHSAQIAFFKAQSEIDSLTGAHNRRSIEQLIDAYLAGVSATTVTGAFILIDLDDFKAVNDQLGHIQGDIVLMEAVNCMKQMCGVYGEIGRLGGDEFILFLKEHGNPMMIEELVGQMMQMLRRTYQMNEQSVQIGASAGIAIYPDHGTTFHSLYHAADQALYRSKSKGKGSYTIWQPTWSCVSVKNT